MPQLKLLLLRQCLLGKYCFSSTQKLFAGMVVRVPAFFWVLGQYSAIWYTSIRWWVNLLVDFRALKLKIVIIWCLRITLFVHTFYAQNPVSINFLIRNIITDIQMWQYMYFAEPQNCSLVSSSLQTYYSMDINSVFLLVILSQTGCRLSHYLFIFCEVDSCFLIWVCNLIYKALILWLLIPLCIYTWGMSLTVFQCAKGGGVFPYMRLHTSTHGTRINTAVYWHWSQQICPGCYRSEKVGLYAVSRLGVIA